uniref:LAGLIDADG homing endonuclease n=1 Tax=Clandestinovirus TaxID=2831644 RepID=A0A8F8KMF0_9VIRU|nr:LAGLIDADG homing endonuclease [Clandestinovirus]
MQKVYGGTIYTYNWGYHVVHKKDKKTYRKGFSFSDSDDAYTDAVIYKKEMSDKLGLTIGQKWIPDSVKTYVAGFFDGDGCVTYYNKKYKDSTYIGPVINFTQAQQNGIPQVLLFIQSYYGGKLNNAYQPKKPTERKSYKLTLYNAECIWMLKDLSSRCVVKSKQVDLALQLGEEADVAIKTTICRQMSEEKQLSSLNASTVDSSDERLCMEYIAGLLDAEGCVISKNRCPVISIAQLSNISLLCALRERLGITAPKAVSIKEGKLTFSGPSAIRFIHAIHEMCIVKREQLQLALRNTEISNDDEIKTNHQKICALKRI